MGTKISLQSIFNIYSKGTSHIEIQSLMELFYSAFRKSNESSLIFLFEIFDRDADGRLSDVELQEMRTTLKLFPSVLPHAQTPLALQGFLEEAGRQLDIDDYMGQFKPLKTLSAERNVVALGMQDVQESEGAVRILLERKWWEAWKKYVNYDIAAGGVESPLPPKIDNSTLFKSKSTKELRTDLIEGHDYVLITEAVWKELFEQYGGGPEIKREIENIGGQLKLVLHKKSINIVILHAGSKSLARKLDISEKLTLEQVLSKVHSEVQLHRFKVYRGLTEEAKVPIENPSALVSDLALVADEVLYFEINDPELDTEMNENPSSVKIYEYVGIVNTVSNCYANCILQCLHFIDSFRETVLSNPRRIGQSPVADSLVRVFKNLAYKSKTVISIDDFLLIFTELHSQFAQRQQHDAQEFLMYLLNDLDVNANDMNQPSLITDLNFDEVRISINQQLLNESALWRLSCLMSQVQRTCSSCNFVDYRFEKHRILDLPMPSSGSPSLEALIRSYLGDAQTQRVCSNCNTNCNAIARCTLLKLPDILIICLKRFSIEEGRLIKNEGKIKLSESFLIQRSTYAIQALAAHEGNLDSGHYRAICHLDSEWIEFNDDNISRSEGSLRD
eukprot:CAMPEP_0204898414 /NCGR_PEP_ID=MMETSP1397-20131031/1282_1 /ASSEMBLY_ACC=CAM_ASM_000891 /TAXON_ID=49980 /ORGANISM="Climacostomum Climacostomum virens, Strain Stock W-24" /LENGTH=616 /DNA_ID=CAMNT_0052066263 /DNA_START=114 /DNA_END=1961 /DNA_ORIENTATION=+